MRVFQTYGYDNYDFRKKQLTSVVASLTSTPKVNVHKITFLLKLEDTIEGCQYVRMKFGKRAHFINLTEKGPGIKNYL
jgi:hypothetical protein